MSFANKKQLDINEDNDNDNNRTTRTGRGQRRHRFVDDQYLSIDNDNNTRLKTTTTTTTTAIDNEDDIETVSIGSSGIAIIANDRNDRRLDVSPGYGYSGGLLSKSLPNTRGFADSDGLAIDDIIEVKPILKRKSLDETETLKTLQSILKKNHSLDAMSSQKSHTILKRHSLGSESDHRSPAGLMMTSREIDITSSPSPPTVSKPSSATSSTNNSSNYTPFSYSSTSSSRIHSILKHKSLDDRCVGQSARDGDQSLPKPILKKHFSIEDELEKCLHLNNGSAANGSSTSSSGHSSSASTSSSSQTMISPNHDYNVDYNSRGSGQRSILKTGAGVEPQKSSRVRVVMNRTVEMKSILKADRKPADRQDSKPVKSALKKSDQNVDNQKSTPTEPVKSILKSESIGSIELIDTSDEDDDGIGDDIDNRKSFSSSASDGHDVDNEMANHSVTITNNGDDIVIPETIAANEFLASNGTKPCPTSSSTLRESEEKSNQRFLLNNRKLDNQKRPASCIGTMSSSATVPIDIDGKSKATDDAANDDPVVLRASSVGSSISDRLAALKHNGEEEWKKRVSKSGDEKDVVLRPHDNRGQLLANRNRATSIADRLSLLEDSSAKWKTRVKETDVKQFTIEGKMADTDVKVAAKTPDIQRKTPKAKTFRSEKTAEALNAMLKKEPQFVVPKVVTTLAGPSSDTQSRHSDKSSDKEVVKEISILKTDDKDFQSFFVTESLATTSSGTNGTTNETISDESFDNIGVGVSSLLRLKRSSVKPQSRRRTSGNPIRSLCAKSDFIVDSYTETIETNNNNKSEDKFKTPKKPKDLTKSSSFAAEALAGLASREDFKAVAGRLRSSSTRDSDWKSYDMPNSMQSVMLVQIKGRRRAQTRLVKPDIGSMNGGDCYVLVTKDHVFVYIGLFANIIERTKALEIANQIQEKKDLCFKSSNSLVVIDCQKSESMSTRSTDLFLKQLNAKSMDGIKPTGAPDEDDVYEDTIIGTNLIYCVNNEKLVPYEEYWGRAPRHEMLDTDRCYVLDMGCEMYVWIGNRATAVERRCALDAAKDLWNRGYDYSECDVNPFGSEVKQKDSQRPQWSWFTKVSQNMEPILFKDKFLNWPSVPSLPTTPKTPVKGGHKFADLAAKRQSYYTKDVSADLNFTPIDAKELIDSQPPEPDMILETAHLGRGVRWSDELEGRHIVVTSLDMKCWRISEYEKHELLAPDSYYFYTGDTYVVRWHYRLSRVGRQLKTGDASRHSMIGRDRNCYFFWHGLHTKNTEKGASALMTIELDKEKAQQVRVSENREEPCFLNVFKGSLVILKGKRGQTGIEDKWRMFYVRGVVPNEATLVEVDCQIQSLRSRTAFAFIKPLSRTIYLWVGCKCLDETRSVMQSAVDNVINNKSSELRLKLETKYVTKEYTEGKEGKEFWDVFGDKSHISKPRQMYHSLIDNTLSYDFTPRLYHITSLSGEFRAKEILCSYRSGQHVTPYPFTQEDLYSAQQPTFFLLDNRHQIFLWESKYPFVSTSAANGSTIASVITDDPDLNATTGSLGIRWSAERKCALDSALAYCFAKNSAEPPNGFVVCAGLEPDCFCGLFPQWTYREDVALLHQQDDRKPGEMMPIQEVLSQYKSQYSLEELRRRPLPEGLNALCLESYLGVNEFQEALEMSREEFYGLPIWRQTHLKQKANLF